MLRYNHIIPGLITIVKTVKLPGDSRKKYTCLESSFGNNIKPLSRSRNFWLYLLFWRGRWRAGVGGGYLKQKTWSQSQAQLPQAFTALIL